MLIEVGVVNAHSPFIVLFLYKDRISYPLWMDYFFNEASREEFSYFPFDCLSFVLSKPAKALLFAQLVRVHLGYARSVPWAPLAYPLVSTRICLG
jgi:hypothetical protein